MYGIAFFSFYYLYFVCTFCAIFHNKYIVISLLSVVDDLCVILLSVFVVCALPLLTKEI